MDESVGERRDCDHSGEKLFGGDRGLVGDPVGTEKKRRGMRRGCDANERKREKDSLLSLDDDRAFQRDTTEETLGLRVAVHGSHFSV